MQKETPADTSSNTVSTLALAALSVGVVICTTLYSFCRNKTSHISDDATYGFVGKRPKGLSKR